MKHLICVVAILVPAVILAATPSRPPQAPPVSAIDPFSVAMAKKDADVCKCTCKKGECKCCKGCCCGGGVKHNAKAKKKVAPKKKKAVRIYQPMRMLAGCVGGG